MMRKIAMTASLVALACAAQPVMAQDASENAGVGDIIVTAQKRAQRLQDVPISVSAFSKEMLVNANIQTSMQLTQITPGLRMTQSTINTHPFIRGVGSAPSTAGDEASVATYVDGVYIPQFTGAVFDLGNIESIEVLKGPQGTLFGRNATSGAIQITTVQPSYEPVAELEAAYGNYNMVSGRAYLSTGLSEKVAIGVAGSYMRRDGFYYNLRTGKNFGGFHKYSIRGKLLFDASDRLSITLIADHNRSTDKSGLFLAPINRNSSALIQGVAIPTRIYDVSLNAMPYANIRSTSGAARVEYEGDGFNILSISSYIRHKFDVTIDVDGTSAPITEIRQRSPDRSWSQELQISSENDSNLSWLAGLFYFHRNTRGAPLTTVVGTAAPRLVTAEAENSAYAAFVDGTYKLGQLELTAGLRYSSERKKMSNATNGVPAVVGAKKTFSAFTPRIVLSYKPTSDFLAYASYSRGFKSGIFNSSTAAATSAIPIDPEKISAFEVGMKASVSPAFSINGALFWYDQTDLQVTANDRVTGLTLLTNAGKARVKGAELEAVARPIRDFSVRVGVSLLDAKYRNFPNAQVTLPNPATGGRGNIQVIRDVSGSRTIRTPKVTVSTGAEYTYRIESGGKLTASSNLFYSSDFYWDVLNRVRTPAHILLNAQLKWTLPDDKVSFSLFGSNLTRTKIYRNVTSSGPGDVADRIDPRMYGVRASIAF